MKIFKILFIILMIFFSCKTTGKITIENTEALKEKILKYNLTVYAEDDYKEAEEIYLEYNELIKAKKNMQAKSALKLLTKQYNMIFNDSMPLYTQDVNNQTINAKISATEIKADVAVKDKYQEALNAYDEALKQNNEKNYEAALELFKKADEIFKVAYEDAKVKKDKTNNSITEASTKMEELKKTVSEFEKQLTDAENLKNKKDQTK